MSKERASKNLKLKIEDVSISAIVEEPMNITTDSDLDIKNFHYHVIYELFYVGDSPLIIHSEDGAHTFVNCLVCIPPFYKHRTIRKKVQRILISIDKSARHTSEFSRFIDDFFESSRPFEIKLNEPLLFLCRELGTLFRTDDTLTDEVAASVLKLIFYNLYVTNMGLGRMPIKAKTNATNESYLVKIDDVINNFRRDTTLKSLAEELHLSTKQTSRIIQKNYNKKLSELVNEKRLSVAAELLIFTDKSVAEIVEYVNFSSEKYFYSLFKKRFGCTPLKYRKGQGVGNSA